MKKCKECSAPLDGKDKRQKFCSRSCGVIFNNRLRKPITEETRKKLVEAGIRSAAGKYKKDTKSILEYSKRTVTKILKRLKVGCSNCGWNKTTCDIHHIKGRKIKDCDNHLNLTILCPNCHRLAHEGKLKNFTTIDGSLPKNWKDSYYG